MFVFEGDIGDRERVDQGLIAFDAQLERWREVHRLAERDATDQPVKRYRISSRYGSRKDPVNGRRAFHGGIDLAGPRNQPVRATAHGKVLRAGRVGRYGRFIEVEHANGIRTRYGHLAKILVKAGQRVRKGEKIGLLGSSGRSTGPHLHYEIVIRGKLVDPLKFLKVGKHVFKG